jgi:hypothetical protein
VDFAFRYLKISGTAEVRRMRSAGRVARVAEMRNAYNNLVVKSVGKRPLGTSGCTREDNIRKDLRKTEREYVGWMHLAQDRYQWPAVVNTVMNLGVP